MITILFFGRLKEVLKTERLEIDSVLDSHPINSVSALRAMLQKKGENWQEYLAVGKTLVAVNHEISPETTVIKDLDEIAFFPPVTGG